MPTNLLVNLLRYSRCPKQILRLGWMTVKTTSEDVR